MKASVVEHIQISDVAAGQAVFHFTSLVEDAGKVVAALRPARVDVPTSGEIALSKQGYVFRECPAPYWDYWILRYHIGGPLDVVAPGTTFERNRL